MEREGLKKIKRSFPKKVVKNLNIFEKELREEFEGINWAKRPKMTTKEWKNKIYEWKLKRKENKIPFEEINRIKKKPKVKKDPLRHLTEKEKNWDEFPREYVRSYLIYANQTLGHLEDFDNMYNKKMGHPFFKPGKFYEIFDNEEENK